ncbi:MAG: zinc metallopeptidase [Opitutales bacterium]|nr:zinc metallopeptidase [Opitutales bacterium]
MNFLIFIIIPIILGLYAQAKVSGAYGKNSRILSRRGITGAEAAREVMGSAGIDDVDIVEISGHLTDHYNPETKTLALSRENYRGTSLAAVGVAAHEAGHAIQHKQAYAPLKTRMALVPITQLASSILPVVIFGGFVLLGGRSGILCMEICVVIYLIMTVFQLVTLPVEYNASARAKASLQDLGILDADEMRGVNETLDAAALTYVAAFVTSLGWLLLLLSNRR